MTEQPRVSLQVQRLSAKGYRVKHASVGWWVDGCCGYRISGYCGTLREAVTDALGRVAAAKEATQKPAWYLG